MNRKHRRAIARTERLASVRQTHKIPPQCCALWVPAAQGYVRHFSTHGFGVIELASLARHYLEGEVSRAAVEFRKITGLRVVVRSVYLSQGDS